MDTNALVEVFHLGGMTLGVGLILAVMLSVVHFFTRHMTNMIHRIVILSGLLCASGFFWHIFHAIIHPELKKIDTYVDSAIWILVFFSAAYLVNKLIDEYVWNQIFIDIEKGETLSTSFMRSIISGLVYGIFILVIMEFIFKKEVHSLWTLIGGSTLLLGYAATDIIKELFAGIALNINPAFKKGDFLKFKNQDAKVVDINWRYVILEDIMSNMMFIPNTEMLHHPIYNYRGNINATRFQMSFHVHPNVPPQLLVDILMPALKQLPHLAPRDWYQDNVAIHIKNCDGHSMEFVAEILVDRFENLYEIKTITYKVIWYALSHHDIPLLAYHTRVDLPIENYKQMLKFWGPQLSKKGVAALLKKSFLFEVCSQSEIEKLVEYAVFYEFVPDQHLYSEGDDGDILFLIKSGTVQLTKKASSGDVLITKILAATDAVGVNAVITGQKRERSAVAVTHVLAYGIKRDILKQVVDKYHERIQHIADQIIYEEGLREKDFQVYLEKKTREEQKMRQSIIGQIRDFLGISDASGL